MLTLRHPSAGAAAVVIAAAFGAGLVLYSTALGIGTGSDSPIYLMAAHSVLAGKGLTLANPGGGEPVPMTGFPPLLSVILAGMGRAGIDPAAGARWLNALLFAAAILMIGWIVRRHTGSQWAGVFAAWLAAVTVDVLNCYCVLLSEPVFIFFALSGVLALLFYIERPSLPLLLLFSTAFGLAAATRYAGASALPACGGAILFKAGSTRRRLLHFAVFLGIFGAPVLLWLARNTMLTANAWGRAPALHPPGPHLFAVSFVDLSGWLLPAAVPKLLRVIALALLLGLLFLPFFDRFRGGGPAVVLHRVLVAFLVSYVLVYVIALTCVDAQAWIVRRHLLAIYLAGLPAVACTVKQLLDRSNAYGRCVCVVLCLAFVGLGLARAGVWAVKSHRDGIGFNSRRWQNSSLAERLRKLDSRAPIISNSVSAVYLLTGRSAEGIPSRMNPQTRLMRPEYEAETARIRHKLENQNGVVVLFAGFPDHFAGPSGNGIEKHLGLHKWAVTDQGYLLSKRPPAGL